LQSSLVKYVLTIIIFYTLILKQSHVLRIAIFKKAEMFQALQQVKQGKISAKELCEKCLQRAGKVKELNAFITDTPDVARKQLQSIQNGMLKQVKRMG
jgi:hypothetical protein